MTVLCHNFQDYPHDTVLGWGFRMPGASYIAFGKGKPDVYPPIVKWENPDGLISFPFSNETIVIVNENNGGERYLRFSDPGISIRLDVAVSEVLLDVAAKGGKPLEITAYDSQGNVVAQVTVPADSDFHSISLVGEEIKTISITGGLGEGALAELCSYREIIRTEIDEHRDLSDVREELNHIIDLEGMPDDVREIIESVGMGTDDYSGAVLQDLIDYYDRSLEEILKDPRLNEFERIIAETPSLQPGSDNTPKNGSDSKSSPNGISLGGGRFGLSFNIDWERIRCFFKTLAKKAFIGWLTDIVSNLDPISGAKEKMLQWGAAKLGITVALLERFIFWVSIGNAIYVSWYLCLI